MPTEKLNHVWIFFGKYALLQKHFPKQLWEFYRVYIYPIKPVQFIRKCFRIDFNLPLKYLPSVHRGQIFKVR